MLLPLALAALLFLAAHAADSWLRDLRRELHQHPELAFEEHETSKILQRELHRLGVPFTASFGRRAEAELDSTPTRPVTSEPFVGGTGIVVELGTGSAPCVAIRADMDGLPITEMTEVPWASKAHGRMHACGHDAHMAMAMGAIKLLKDRDLKGTVRVIFQPAEERYGGAQDMILDGVLEGEPAVESIFGLHVNPFGRTGTVVSAPGPLLAGAAQLEVTITGTPGHAATPHLAGDTVATAAAVIQAIHVAVGRRVTPGVVERSGLVSLTSVQSSTDAFNILPSEVHLKGTLRALSSPFMEELKAEVERAVRQTTAAFGQDATIKFGTSYSVVTVDAELLEWSKKVLEENNADFSVIPPLMFAEDFAFYCERVDCLFLMLGVNPSEGGSAYPLHHPQFTLDEAALPLGAKILADLAEERLNYLTTQGKDRIDRTKGNKTDKTEL